MYIYNNCKHSNRVIRVLLLFSLLFFSPCSTVCNHIINYLYIHIHIYIYICVLFIYYIHIYVCTCLSLFFVQPHFYFHVHTHTHTCAHNLSHLFTTFELARFYRIGVVITSTTPFTSFL